MVKVQQPALHTESVFIRVYNNRNSLLRTECFCTSFPAPYLCMKTKCLKWWYKEVGCWEVLRPWGWSPQALTRQLKVSWHLDLGLPASWIVSNKFLLFLSHSIYGILLPEQTKTLVTWMALLERGASADNGGCQPVILPRKLGTAPCAFCWAIDRRKGKPLALLLTWPLSYNSKSPPALLSTITLLY